mmetsp:Transcript_71104/g.170314  ORF Transcript_71104/g.170314 Transcript_71104/m.170314 type:complete len:205 (-) Transcript_71104:1405-2019(-)
MKSSTMSCSRRNAFSGDTGSCDSSSGTSLQAGPHRMEAVWPPPFRCTAPQHPYSQLTPSVAATALHSCQQLLSLAATVLVRPIPVQIPMKHSTQAEQVVTSQKLPVLPAVDAIPGTGGSLTLRPTDQMLAAAVLVKLQPRRRDLVSGQLCLAGAVMAVLVEVDARLLRHLRRRGGRSIAKLQQRLLAMVVLSNWKMMWISLQGT